jgi:hypothetical protein
MDLETQITPYPIETAEDTSFSSIDQIIIWYNKK